MSHLTPARLFSDPPLSAALPSGVRLSPDGTVISYLRPAADDRERLDLWRYTLGAEDATLWVDGRTLGQGDAQTLTAAEKAQWKEHQMAVLRVR